MKTVKKIFNKSFNRLKRIKLNHKIFTFFFFLFLSIIFWFLNALNKKYVANISFPVKYINFPKDKMTFGKIQSKLDAQVAAYGYSFLDYKISKKEPVIVDLKIHTLHLVKNRKKRYYILSNVFKNDISSVLGENIVVKKINQDSIIFNFEEIIRRKIPVKSNVILKLEKQYILKDSIRFFPDSIFIKGLKSNIDTINEVYSVTKVIENVNDSININIDLKKIKNVVFQKEAVICKAVAEEFTEMNFKIPIRFRNLPDSVNIKLFPSDVKIAFNVGFSNYDKILANQFQFIIDFSEIDINKEEKLRIKLDKLPKEVYLVRYYPKNVGYIVEKND